jgi:hypothetical protein
MHYDKFFTITLHECVSAFLGALASHPGFVHAQLRFHTQWRKIKFDFVSFKIFFPLYNSFYFYYIAKRAKFEGGRNIAPIKRC